ncbi:response regulator transcription factor [Actinoallomurus sp. NBC_01490]|jgi:DNA-binding NarL/FixJ family response regulator|uniref:response regulator n=1 Tax=Actinoallomurus sp. NBC_01490 TaxID=2903557 RepID=UPI002E37DE50|nr:response regulator transcription factor [Actinoallomurus sp. NBC_01490]
MDMRCLIVDDNDRFLETARGVLERDGINVVGVASDGQEALEKVGELRPTVALVDVCLGEECGVELAGLLIDESPSKPVVILISTYPADDFADIVAGSAALGFLPKSELSGPALRKMIGEIDRASSEQPG